MRSLIAISFLVSFVSTELVSFEMMPFKPKILQSVEIYKQYSLVWCVASLTQLERVNAAVLVSVKAVYCLKRVESDEDCGATHSKRAKQSCNYRCCHKSLGIAKSLSMIFNI